MDTRLTLADCRAALYTEVAAANANDPLFAQRLNEGCERYFYSGKWKGMVVKAIYPAAQGFITLSRYHLCLLAMRYKKVPRPIFTQFLSFAECGPGEMDDAHDFPGILQDLGDGFATQSDIATAGVLRVTLSNASDAAKTIRLYGRDENGMEIFDTAGAAGVNITTGNPTADTAKQFSQVTGIQAPANMLGYWTLSVVNSGTPTQIGSYMPGETRPSYRRYQTGVTEEAIQVICTRRFVPVVAETDWVIPGNQSALRAALQGLAMEYGSQIPEAEACFNRGLGLLNEEAKAARGGAIPTVNRISDFSYGVQIGA